MSEAEKLLKAARQSIDVNDARTATIQTRMAMVYATLEVAATVEAVTQRLDVIHEKLATIAHLQAGGV